MKKKPHIKRICTDSHSLYVKPGDWICFVRSFDLSPHTGIGIGQTPKQAYNNWYRIYMDNLTKLVTGRLVLSSD